MLSILSQKSHTTSSQPVQIDNGDTYVSFCSYCGQLLCLKNDTMFFNRCFPFFLYNLTFLSDRPDNGDKGRFVVVSQKRKNINLIDTFIVFQ